MKKINRRKWGWTVGILALVGLALPYFTQWPMTVAVSQVALQVPFFLMTQATLAGWLLIALWPFFWFAVAIGIVATLWAKFETLRAWGITTLVLIIAGLVGTPVLSVALAMGFVTGLVGQSLVGRFNTWART